MSGTLTKRDENFNHRFHRFTQIFHFLSVFVSVQSLWRKKPSEGFCHNVDHWQKPSEG